MRDRRLERRAASAEVSGLAFLFPHEARRDFFLDFDQAAALGCICRDDLVTVERYILSGGGIDQDILHDPFDALVDRIIFVTNERRRPLAAVLRQNARHRVHDVIGDGCEAIVKLQCLDRGLLLVFRISEDVIEQASESLHRGIDSRRIDVFDSQILECGFVAHGLNFFPDCQMVVLDAGRCRSPFAGCASGCKQRFVGRRRYGRVCDQHTDGPDRDQSSRTGRSQSGLSLDP